ncbi:MAG: hypothetical protein CM1200mP9_07790 [Gammaproteobacteria bacterium]|nr:MAG: hypothetical protein CM1200mP9_07790 [Gammaproteobacteria bacterium]
MPQRAPGGEIRDEGAVGRGSKPKAGLCGFTTSHLEIPGDLKTGGKRFLGGRKELFRRPKIMLEGPVGAAAFNNKFWGRPAICGYFRTFEQRLDASSEWGYHKPVMIAGGLGSIRGFPYPCRRYSCPRSVKRIGGPAMLIGLGGGAASSVGSGTSSSELDFASVQRDNAEIQRRCQEVNLPMRSIRSAKSYPPHSRRGCRRSFKCNTPNSSMMRTGEALSISKGPPQADSGMSPMEFLV